MLFNSVDFWVFLPLTLVGYWFVAGRGVLWRNAFLLVASYVFYGWWDWRFLSLIAGSSLVDYVVGGRLGQVSSDRTRKRLLVISLTTNLGLLGAFKYFGFFAQSLELALAGLGIDATLVRLDWVLPVGISFYTFQRPRWVHRDERRQPRSPGVGAEGVPRANAPNRGPPNSAGEPVGRGIDKMQKASRPGPPSTLFGDQFRANRCQPCSRCRWAVLSHCRRPQSDRPRIECRHTCTSSRQGCSPKLCRS